MNFIHIITTRFNVPTSVWTKTREGAKPLSEDWLNDRFEIFQKYCLPSFINQSNQNFTWLVFFDVNTPEFFKKIIDKIEKNVPQFNALFVDDFEGMRHKALEIIPVFFNKNTAFIITTDIDNDDLLHQEFVSTVQQKFEPRHDLVIDLKRGLQLTKTVDKEAVVHVFYMVANPFVSLVEDKINFGTVMKERHLAYRDFENYKSYDAEPRFIQYIHGHNLVNDTEKNSQRIGKLNQSDYGIAPENYFKISAADAFKANLFRKINLLTKLFGKK